MLDINDIQGGAVSERLNREWQKLVENMMDPNTEWKKARTLTLKLKVTPDESREISTVQIDCSTNLPAAKGIAALMYIGLDDDGKGVSEELKSGTKNQTYFDDAGVVRDDKGKPVAEETAPSGKVVNMNQSGPYR